MEATTNDGSAVATEPVTSSPTGTDPDWFLQQLVDMANHNTLGFPVTLHVGGVTVSGTIISGRKYFESWAAEVSAALNFPNADPEAVTKLKEVVRDQFGRLGAIYPEARSDGDTAEAGGEAQESEYERAKNPPSFIHLADARFFLGSNWVPTNRSVLWRGRISEVEGWFLGTLSAD
jgi:hypothetical protein